MSEILERLKSSQAYRDKLEKKYSGFTSLHLLQEAGFLSRLVESDRNELIELLDVLKFRCEEEEDNY